MAAVIPSLLSFLGGPVAEKLLAYIPDPQQREKAKMDLLNLQETEEFKQIDAALQIAAQQTAVNVAEAQSGDWFARDWRPFIGWTCGFAFAANYVLLPIATWIAALFNKHVPLPTLDMTVMLPVVFGMLGLGYYRTQEKIKGVA